MTHRLLVVTAALALGACAGSAESRPIPGDRPFFAAVRVDPPPPKHLAAAAAVTGIARSAETSVAAVAPPRTRRRRPSAGAADRPPSPQRPATLPDTGLAQVQPWREGALYKLAAAPERVSDIALQRGETLISVAAGDTARWVIGDTTSGSGAGRRTHILVKPATAGLRTNLVISTDRRVYHLELESQARAAMTGISWTYPGADLLALDRADGAAAGDTATPAVAVDTLNFGYRIHGDRPRWRPLRAFDDGAQVFIEFPTGLPSSEAPPLFVTAAGGRAELVNYRVRGRYYVVDRLFDAAELRLGERRQQVVRITRENRQPAGGRDAR